MLQRGPGFAAIQEHTAALGDNPLQWMSKMNRISKLLVSALVLGGLSAGMAQAATSTDQKASPTQTKAATAHKTAGAHHKHAHNK